MADRTEIDLDAALARLAEAERAVAPRPGQGLTARVLADAAAVAAARPAPFPAAAGPTPARGWAEALAGWLVAPRGAAAALALSLVLGIGLGYGTGLPILGEDPALDPVGSLAAGGDFLIAAMAF